MSDSSTLRLLLIHPELELDEVADAAFARWGIEVERVPEQSRALAILYENPPDAIALDHQAGGEDGLRFASLIKRDPALSHIPIVMRLRWNEALEITSWENIPIDDFILDWDNLELLALRLRLCFETGRRELDANPLTRLAGNNAITRSVEQRLERGQDFAVAYLDLDNFKSFNDRYSFSRGDEVIRLTARLIVNSVQIHMNLKDALVGHVGGDDFVFIVTPESVEAICKEFIERFELLITTLYDDEDRKANGIHSVDRKGAKEFFPIISVTIAVALNVGRSVEHIGQISAAVGEIKKHLKSLPGSNYLIDRREPRQEKVEEE